MASLIMQVLSAVALATVPGVAAAANEPVDPWVEFDKKPQHNPTHTAPGQVHATGRINLPPQHALFSVELRHQPEGAANKNAFFVVAASVNEKASPMTWSATVNDLPIGEHRFDVVITAVAPNGDKLLTYSLDIRRVIVKVAKKPVN